MGVGVKVNVWGDYALFTRPELKTERYSYDIITPSAARGILEAIYTAMTSSRPQRHAVFWKPSTGIRECGGSSTKSMSKTLFNLQVYDEMK